MTTTLLIEKETQTHLDMDINFSNNYIIARRAIYGVQSINKNFGRCLADFIATLS
jgi:hypothetical protein